MKLSISNIAWTKEQDEQVYSRMREYGYSALEIAPTRIFPEAPYDHLEEASSWAKQLKEEVILKRKMSAMYSLKKHHEENCDARSVRDSHRRNCDAEGIDRGTV